jgi:hypothetical protein
MGFGELQAEKVSAYWNDHEEGFTTWLVGEIYDDRRSDLEELLDRELEVLEADGVGPYGIDVHARGVNTGEQVVVEDCITGDLDVLTTLAGAAEIGASVVVWIAPSFSERELDALAWLDANTDAIEFVLVQLEIWRIGDSEPAVRMKRLSLDANSVTQFESPAPRRRGSEAVGEQIRAINGRLWRSFKKEDGSL